ncbi:MAG: Glu/Leu/Phe/Val dehydrogenase [Proteobacteria bacterium]|nr:Glu/Leu/Phe/Val dehydrogenase [Pseudomonadota bacterium]
MQECLHVVSDDETGLTGVIAIHSTVLGPAAGGCRFWHYDAHCDLVADAMRLARGMSYKNALAGLPLGGGKAVLQRPKGTFDREAYFKAFGRAIEALKGAYVTAEDVGTNVGDMHTVRQETKHVAGLTAQPGMAGGDPSPWTALGVFESMKAATRELLGFDLSGATVAVQGVGNVGAGLCRRLHHEGAKLVIADLDEARAAALAKELNAKVVGIDEIAAVEAEVFAPCALGGILNADTIPKLRARFVCGGANNQLASDADGKAMHNRGILFAPDYVVNAGGIINVSAEYFGENSHQVRDRVVAIAPRLVSILRQAMDESLSPATVADRSAQELIARARRHEAA